MKTIGTEEHFVTDAGCRHPALTIDLRARRCGKEATMGGSKNRLIPT
jgi:hypothetical protein